VSGLAQEAEEQGRLRSGPTDSAHPGYVAVLANPDGHRLELYCRE
jgi:hypothetical protein